MTGPVSLVELSRRFSVITLCSCAGSSAPGDETIDDSSTGEVCRETSDDNGWWEECKLVPSDALLEQSDAREPGTSSSNLRGLAMSDACEWLDGGGDGCVTEDPPS